MRSLRRYQFALSAAMLGVTIPLTPVLGIPIKLPAPSELHSSLNCAAVAANLAGTWDGVLQLDSAWRNPNQPSARSATARIRFRPVGDASPTIMSSRSVHGGNFEIDFSRFGFTLSTTDALGWAVNDESVRAVLNPAVDHGMVELSGRISGDTMAGTWRYVSDPGGATGTFRLRRVTTAQDAATTFAAVTKCDSSVRSQ